MRRIYLGIILIFTLSLGLSQGKNYPSRFYIVGEGSAPNTESPDDLTGAKERAMGDLSNQIQASVNSEFVNEVTESSKSLSEYAHSKIKVISKMQIEGAQYETEKTDDMITVRAILRKDLAADLYFQKTKQLTGKLQNQMARVNELLNNGENETALSQLFSASKIFNEIEQNIIIYMILGGMETDILQPKLSRTDLDDKIFKLTEQNFNSFDDVVNGLCFQIAKQVKPDQKITIFPLQFQNTSFGSQFSDYVRQQILFSLPKFLKFQQAENKPQQVNEGISISGTYWLRDQQMELLITMYDAQGVTFGSARLKFPLSFVENLGVAYKPQNFVDAMSENKYFNQDEVVSGDLKIDFWTNKGDDNLIFEEGERMQMFVRVNTPCNLRLIYHLANGMRTPLVETFYIDQAKVNHVVEIAPEYDIVCAPPFGVEKLQIFASSMKLPKLNTTSTTVDGEEYIVLADDLKKFLEQSRGFVRKKPAQAKTAERVITITTVEKSKLDTEGK